MGLFRISEKVINLSDGLTVIRKTTHVTGKGQIYFINKFLNIAEADIIEGTYEEKGEAQ